MQINWATNESAKYACENWHYSKCLPIGKQVRVGVWESGRFIGALIFAPGACPELGKPYGLGKYEVCELVRVALTTHKTPVSRIMAIGLKFLKRQSPNLRLVVSFADPNEGHHGGIYQATNWIFAGVTSKTVQYWFRGKWTHPKTFRSEWADLGHIDTNKLKKRVAQGKLRYLMPLDSDTRSKIEPLAKPYPKRAVSIANDATANHAVEGGANPTTALHFQNGAS